MNNSYYQTDIFENNEFGHIKAIVYSVLDRAEEAIKRVDNIRRGLFARHNEIVKTQQDHADSIVNIVKTQGHIEDRISNLEKTIEDQQALIYSMYEVISERLLKKIA